MATDTKMRQGDSGSHRFKVRDASSYDSVTAEFDRFTERVTGPLASRMVALAGLESSERVLDVGTGTGIVALRAAGRLGPGGQVWGVDLSDPMLKHAMEKAVQAGLSGRVRFAKMDAEALELPDRSFDVVLSLFALLHFPNPLSALREIFRVLKPGGRMVVAVGSGPPLFSLVGFLQGARRFRRVGLQLRGKVLTAPGFLNALTCKHLPGFEEPEETSLASRGPTRTRSVAGLVRRAGFRDLHPSWQGEQVVFDTPEAYWDVQRTFSSLARKRLSSAPPDKVQAVKDEFVARCRQVQARGGFLLYPIAAFYVSARRPLASPEGEVDP